MKNKLIYLWGILLLILVFPNYLLADAGIPVFYFFFAWQVLVLVLIIFCEYIYLSKKLPNLKKKLAIKITLIANLVSTFIGYLFLFLIRWPFQKCIFYRCGEPYTKNETINNMLNIFNDPLYWGLGPIGSKPRYLGTLSVIVLLLSCFLVSWLFEYFVFYYMQKKIYSKKEICKAICIANIISYTIFFVIPILFFD